MIHDVFDVLKRQLNTFVGSRLAIDAEADTTIPDPYEYVGYPDGTNGDGLAMPKNRISLVLCNVEEETTLRSPTPHQMKSRNGAVYRTSSDVRINLLILFVANHERYPSALRLLSLVIEYFQANRRLDGETVPKFPDLVDHLAVELVTMTLAEQNEVWGTLRSPYHPSVMYRVKMLVFRNEGAEDTLVTEVESHVGHREDLVS